MLKANELLTRAHILPSFPGEVHEDLSVVGCFSDLEIIVPPDIVVIGECVPDFTQYFDVFVDLWVKYEGGFSVARVLRFHLKVCKPSRRGMFLVKDVRILICWVDLLVVLDHN